MLATKEEIQLRKRKKSQNQLRKSRYEREVFVLGKITKDLAVGISVDIEEIKRQMQAVEEKGSLAQRNVRHFAQKT